MKVKCRPNAKAVRKFRRLWIDFYGFHCAYCTVDCTNSSTIDHLIPLSRGGGNTRDNMVLACHDCNEKKGSKLLTEFRPLILNPIGYEVDYGYGLQSEFQYLGEERSYK